MTVPGPDVRATRVPRVLVVDDDVNDLRSLRLTLEGQGFEVVACPNYNDGLRCLVTAPCDLVVVNQGTPAFEGRSVLDLSRKLDPRRAVLVLTRCLDMRCYCEAMQMGALDYLEKPVSSSDLLSFVRAHVDDNHA